ncbi:MAG: hypothetical protein Q8R38_02915 [Candidatus Omnitrophota bacterium]|nr:hypothetical protein [Candidatus Omnitrophota bacterium]
MSKILDALDNKATKKHASGLGMQDEIAKTYFHASQKKPVKKKPKWAPFLPWLVTAVVIVLAIVMVLSKSSIDIKVRLLGEIPTFKGPVAPQAVDKGEFLVKGGQPQADIVKNAYFAGDGKAFSEAKEEEVVLCNARGAGWANYTIELKEPVNLNNLDVVYTAKGARGDESLVLVIADSNNRTYRMEKDLSSALKDEWKKHTINFRSVKKTLDLSSIVAIKFEFGSLTAGNYSSAVINLKDVCLTKTRRLKWL